MRKFFAEFKKFISRGNVFDLATGMIIATAFNKIVSSLVNDIIMPLITYGTGAASLKDLSLPLRYSINPATGIEEVSLSWAYGNFLQTIIDFLIIALSVFIMVKVINSSKDKLSYITKQAIHESKKEVRDQKKKLKQKAKEENRPYKEVLKEHEMELARVAEEKKKQAEIENQKKVEQELLENPTTEMLLKEIIDLLKDRKDNNKKSGK